MFVMDCFTNTCISIINFSIFVFYICIGHFRSISKVPMAFIFKSFTLLFSHLFLAALFSKLRGFDFFQLAS